MSLTGKSAKTNTKTQTKNGKTTTTVTVEETFKYSDGSTKTQTREMVTEGPPPTQEAIKKFIESGVENLDALKNLSIASGPDKEGGKSSKQCNNTENSSTNTSPEEYAKEALVAHNGLRAKHGVPALSLASDLCAKAQEWADYLLKNNKMGHSPKDNRADIGENIAYMQGSSPNLDYPAKDATESWYSEIKDYKSYYGKEPPPFGSVPAYGHFTQVVWKGSKEMGIGKARGNGRVVVVANYRPAGNYVGSYSENVFPPK